MQKEQLYQMVHLSNSKFLEVGWDLSLLAGSHTDFNKHWSVKPQRTAHADVTNPIYLLQRKIDQEAYRLLLNSKQSLTIPLVVAVVGIWFIFLSLQ